MEQEPVKPAVEKIAKECEKSGATKWETIRIIKELNEEEKITEQKLKEKALVILRSLNPEAAKVFESFARMHVHNSKQLIEQFDRGNIVKSLLLETHSSRAIAEKIGAEVEDKIKDLKIRHLTTALIREMVNAKLLEYGLEDLRKKYARLGMPVADIEKEMEKGLFENKEILTEYNLEVAIPEELAEMHFNADIHIAFPEDFSTKPFGISIKPEKNFSENQIALLLEKIMRGKKFFSTGPNLENFNFIFSNSEEKAGSKKSIKNAFTAMEILSAANSHCGKIPSITHSLFVPEQFENNRKKNAIGITNAMLNNSKTTSFLEIIAIDSKYCIKALEEKCFEKELFFLNSSKEELSIAGMQLAFPAKKCSGIIGLVGLNLEKIALQNAGKESAFEQEMLEKTIAIKKILELKKELLEKRNYLKENNIFPEEQRPAVGIYNLQIASAILLEKKQSDKESLSYSEKILKKTKEFLGENWIVSDFSNEEGKKRFCSFNEKEFRTQLENCREMQQKEQGQEISRNRQQLEEAIDSGKQIIHYIPK